MNVVVYHGSQDDREIIRNYEFYYKDKAHNYGSKLECVITSPEAAVALDKAAGPGQRARRELSKIHWDVVVVDEAHKLKNYDSKLSTTLREEFSYGACALLTGTAYLFHYP